MTRLPVVCLPWRVPVSPRVVRWLGALALLSCVGLSGAASELNANLREEVVMVPKPALFTLDLETTAFAPSPATATGPKADVRCPRAGPFHKGTSDLSCVHAVMYA